ncbi:MAG: macro domain-containing protein [Rhodanobacteraceae bacterium]
MARCYTESPRLALEHGLSSIAFRAISCGVFGYPLDHAATQASRFTIPAPKPPGMSDANGSFVVPGRTHQRNAGTGAGSP